MRGEKANSGTVAKLQDAMPDGGQASSANSAGVIDQVRELLFGETKRTTEQGLKSLEDKLDALVQTMHTRFAEIESRMSANQSEAERSQAGAIDDIGAAIAQLGANIRNMSGARKTK